MNVENLPSLQPIDFGSLKDPNRPILSTDYFARGPHCVKGHTHARAQILYPLSGVYRVRTSMGNWVVPPRQAIWIPPHIFHEVYSNDTVDSLLFFIDETFASPLPQECVVVSVSPLLREMFIKAVKFGNDYSPESRCGRFVEVLLDEIGEMQPAPLYLPLSGDKRVGRVMDLLLQKPADALDLEQLADYSGSSVRNLARLFKKETGMNFSEWRKQLILMEAIDQLGQGKSVTEVALDLGYTSASAFIAMFRRTLGVAPGHYFENNDNANRSFGNHSSENGNSNEASQNPGTRNVGM
ncbi:AraC family transcriptional regulator [Kaarinaea lacus]